MTVGLLLLAADTADPTNATVLWTGSSVTVTDLVTLRVAPWLSVTVSLTLYVPAAPYVWLGLAAVDVAPSPNVHAYEAMLPSGSPAADESNRHSNDAHELAKSAVGI